MNTIIIVIIQICLNLKYINSLKNLRKLTKLKSVIFILVNIIMA